MAIIQIYNLKGEKKEELKVADSVFGLPANDDLVGQVAVAMAGNQRQVLAHTKTRAERAGSGKKPWRQKGTGRARVGSVRTPTWRKGGVAFGPRSDRNYKRKINKKMKVKAIKVVLSGKVRDNEMIVLDKLELPEKKTKKMAAFIKNLKVTGKSLIAFLGKERDLAILSRNIKGVSSISTEKLNVLDMLRSKNLIISEDSVKYLESKYK